MDSYKRKTGHESWAEFIEKVLEYNPHANQNLVKKAFDFAHKVHWGQKRESGEAYFQHPVEVAKILIDLKADSSTIAAALLHDAAEDAKVSISEISKEFGEEVASLVEGVTKITGVRFETKEEYTAENLRKILLATAKDVRVILIKLADRLHNMRTLRSFRPDKQVRIAQETLNIYAPIAHKLGIRQIKGELEDLSLKYIDPLSYKKLSRKISEKREEREEKTRDFITTIVSKLKEHDIDAEVEGRAKYFYSIYNKMKKENKDFNEIYDLIGIRIITKTIPECYAALGIIHELWKPIPKRFKDYLSVPKANGYQSLHTSVIGRHGKILEIQIRTKEMHIIAEAGIAAHWRYKGTERDKKFDRKIAWLKQLLEWKQESNTAREFVETLKIDLFENEIVVFTPKGDPISLPEHSTPVDFAYEVHTNVGHKCSKAMVNNKLVPLNTILKSGDVVYILTQKNAIPSRNWLSFVRTSKAKSKIKSILNIKREHTPKADRIKLATPDEPAPLLADRILVDGKKAQIKFSKCCSPRFGDTIVGFYTKQRDITVHKADCPNSKNLGKNRAAKVSWIEDNSDDESVKMRISIKDRIGLLAEILSVISDSKVNVESVNTRTKRDKINLTFKMKLPPGLDLKNLIDEVRKVKNVLDVKECKA